MSYEVTNLGSARELNMRKVLNLAFQRIGALEMDQGILAQAWLPLPAAGGEILLQTKGLPFSVNGPGDMLALFRCLSCKFSFSPDLKQLALMGGPGRVYHSGEAEMSENVQQCDISVYSRVKEARDCRVCSTILLPIFADNRRKEVAAVLELVQFTGTAASFRRIFEWSQEIFEACGMYLPWNLEQRTFEMQSHAMSIRSISSSFGGQFADLPPFTRKRPAVVIEDLDRLSHLRTAESSNLTTTSPAEHKGLGPSSSSRKDSSEGTEDEQGKESKKALHPRALVSRQDLERHFGYSLAEAAVQLGVCKTTVKRACRRYGILRWPRREYQQAAGLHLIQEQLQPPSQTAARLDGWGSSFNLAPLPCQPASHQLPQPEAESFQYDARGDAAVGPQASGTIHAPADSGNRLEEHPLQPEGTVWIDCHNEILRPPEPPELPACQGREWQDLDELFDDFLATAVDLELSPEDNILHPLAERAL